MIAVRTAKSRIKHQEGMNHLWIQLQPIGDVKNARLQIILHLVDAILTRQLEKN